MTHRPTALLEVVRDALVRVIAAAEDLHCGDTDAAAWTLCDLEHDLEKALRRLEQESRS